MKRHLLLLGLLLPLFCSLFGAGAKAASCAMTSPSSLAFGSVDVLNGAMPNTTANMSVSCTGIASGENIRFCIGVVGGGVNLLSIGRYMLRLTNRLYYSFFVTGSVEVFNVSDGGSFYIDLSESVPSINVYFTSSIYGGQKNRPAGYYLDTVIMNGSFASYAGTRGIAPFQDCNFTGTLAGSVSLPVIATVPANCLISATSLTFESQVIFTSALSAESVVTVSCTTGSPYWVSLDNGMNALSGQRRMKSGTNYISYELYRDSARSLRWGATKDVDTVSGTGVYSGTGFPVYGKVPTPATQPPPGTYSDTITATVNF